MRGFQAWFWAGLGLVGVLTVSAACGGQSPSDVRDARPDVPRPDAALAPDGGPEAGQEDAGPGADCGPPAQYQGAGGEGEYLGEFEQTFYWLVLEVECLSPPESPLVDIYDPDGEVIARVSEDFACKLGLEGSGKLADGRVVNYWGSGSACVRYTECSAPYYPSRNCYSVLDPDLYPWGKGVRGRALVPFLSIATDPDVIPYGTIVYVPEWDGYVLPDGSVHDGCLRSDDTGGAIVGDHIDFFAGSEEVWRQVGDDFPEYVHLYVNPERCPVERSWFQAVGAGCCEDADCGFRDAVCLGAPDFPGGYCSLAECLGGDCPDIGGYESFCTDYFTGGTCVQRCLEDSDCRPGYECRSVGDLAGDQGMACVPADR